MHPDNLIHVKDDMVAFIEGHGMRRFPTFVSEDVPSVLWEDEDNAESWKDFVEAAKAAGALFLTMSDITLEKADLEMLIEQLATQNFPDVEVPEVDEAQSLTNHVGKVGYVQLGFPHQGVFFLHETSTPWYDRYQHLLEHVEEFGDIILDDGGDDEGSH